MRTRWLAAVVLLIVGCDDSPTTPDESRTLTRAPYAPLDVAAEDYWQALEASPASHEVRFAALDLFFEYNSTDEDLGLQLFLDAEGWDRVRAIDPDGQQMVDFMVTGELAELGLTEIFFESAEPSPAEVLALIPEGRYRFVGHTVSGHVLRGSRVLSHQLPPAANITHPTEDAVVDATNFTVRWQPLPAGLESIQLIVVNEVNGAELSVDLRATATSFFVPSIFLRRGSEHKVEILTIGANHNKTIAEVSFSTAP